jgi:TPR repeat protein
MHVEGRTCAHPASPDLVVDVSVSTRGPVGAPHAAGPGEGVQFLERLRFTPLAPSVGILDAEDLIRRGAPAEAARLFEALADRGDSAAALRAARLYEGGRGVAADAARAERMYRLAAEAGEVDALYNLGASYDKARGSARDAKEAVRWFLRAADQRDPQAQLNLGILFYKGDGVPVDHSQARAWLELAADNGSARARDLLEALEFRPDPWYGLPVKPTVLLDPP